MKNSFLKNKTILITGGTGSFGYAAVKRLLEYDLKEIRIFSRDRKKQDQMAIHFQAGNSIPLLSFFHGNITDRTSLDRAMNDVDILVHAAAAKEVPFCESNPLEASQINIFGTSNVIESAACHRVKKVVVISTDKACYPIGAMGISKAMMEKVAFAAADKLNTIDASQETNTSVSVIRFGNLMGSNGTVVPLFTRQIKEGNKLTVTNPTMTRFMMTPNDAVDLTLCAINEGKNGDLIIQRAPAASLETLIKALQEIHDPGKTPEIEIIGSRPGEKLFETMATQAEMAKAVPINVQDETDKDTVRFEYLRIPLKGLSVNPNAKEFNSQTSPLDKEGMKSILFRL